MKFIINVAKAIEGTSLSNRAHFCRIELPDHIVRDAQAKARDIAKRFPVSEGFEVTMARWSNTGVEVYF